MKIIKSNSYCFEKLNFINYYNNLNIKTYKYLIKNKKI